jgi:hypothetical protein
MMGCYRRSSMPVSSRECVCVYECGEGNACLFYESTVAVCAQSGSVRVNIDVVDSACVMLVSLVCGWLCVRTPGAPAYPSAFVSESPVRMCARENCTVIILCCQ